jgi:hypothetical protein
MNTMMNSIRHAARHWTLLNNPAKLSSRLDSLAGYFKKTNPAAATDTLLVLSLSPAAADAKADAGKTDIGSVKKSIADLIEDDMERRGDGTSLLACQVYGRKKLMRENIPEVGVSTIVSSLGRLYGTAAAVRLLGIAITSSV